MVTRFFGRPSRTLKHHTLSLLPEVEAIIQTSVGHFFQNVTRQTGDAANFSISANNIILARFTFAVTELRKGLKPDPDAVEWLLDLVEGKRRVTEQDLQEYERFLDCLTDAYCKRLSKTT